MEILSHKHRITIPVDWKLLLPILLLSIVGIITLLSTTILPTGGFGDLSIVWKQLLVILIGFVLYFLISYLDLSYFKYWQVLLVLFLLTAGLLVLTLLKAPLINGTRRWLVIAGFQLQPSEIAKFSIIIITASIFSMRDKFNEFVLLFVTALSAAVFFVLVNLEPAGSMSLLIFAIWFLMIFLALNNPLRNSVLLLTIASIAGGFVIPVITNNNRWYLLILLGVVLTVFSLYSKNAWKILSLIALGLGLVLGVAFSYAWTHNILHSYQKQRITAYINPTGTKSDEWFNVNQSRIAIGSGQLLGKGFGNGTQSKRNFLPEHQTDFIFASFAEEFGLVGCVVVLCIYGFIIIHSFLTGINASHNIQYFLICFGVGIKILLEVFINIGTNTGIIPATGIPLPLMSAGGTITIMTFVCLGLVQNIYLKNRKEHHNKSEEIIDIYED
jgi:rod shape determining protein RodA